MRLCLTKDDPIVRDEVSEALTSFAASLGLVASDNLPARRVAEVGSGRPTRWKGREATTREATKLDRTRLAA